MRGSVAGLGGSQSGEVSGETAPLTGAFHRPGPQRTVGGGLEKRDYLHPEDRYKHVSVQIG